jgi:hypothetical protein
LDCVDEFYGVLPWTQHVLCGFVEDKDSDIALQRLRTFKTSVVTTYTELYKTDGISYFRKISNSFLVAVSFTRQVIALTKTDLTVYINDEKLAASLKVAVLGDALYDVATKNTIISFQTTIVWPYEIAAHTLIGEWKRRAGQAGVISATAGLDSIQAGSAVCDGTQDTDCIQNWILTINTKPEQAVDQVCNLKGFLEFATGNLLCRDFANTIVCPQDPNTNFTISIGQTDLCDNGPEADASAGLTNTLESYFDEEYSAPQNIFQTGDMIFFKVIVKDPVATIDEITFNEVLVRSNVDINKQDTLYKVSHPKDLFTDPNTVKLTAVLFNITKEIRQPTDIISPGSEAVLLFSFKLYRSLQALTTLSSADPEAQAQQLTVEVSLDLWYHGNQKKSIVATSAGALPSTSHAQISFYDMGENTDELNAAENVITPIEEDQLFGSSAASVVASIATIATCAALILA